MGTRRAVRASLASAAAILIGAAAAYAASPAITADGVGAVEVGAKASKLRDASLIGPLRPGCEFGGPQTRSAKLKAPLEGLVNFTLTKPRRVDNILVTGGAKASGVGVGSPKHAIKVAFPHVKFDHTTENTFGITLAKVPKADGGKFQFAVEVATKKVTLIGIPFIAFCE